jgi:hypothetical protein
MSDILKSKYVFGELTLRDLKETIENLSVSSVEINGVLYESFRFYADRFEVWENWEHYKENFESDRRYDLNSFVGVKDGKVIVNIEDFGIKETFVFGKTEFVPTRIEIL